MRLNKLNVTKNCFYVKQQTNSAVRQLAPCSRQIKRDKLAPLKQRYS